MISFAPLKTSPTYIFIPIGLEVLNSGWGGVGVYRMIAFQPVQHWPVS